MRYLLLLLLLTSCSKEIDLKNILYNKTKVFEYVKFDQPGMDYTYCESVSSILATELVRINNKDSLLVVCVAIDSYNEVTRKRARYLKYNLLSTNGKVRFCGWRDFYKSYDEKGRLISDILKKGNSNKCKGFSIDNYSHR